MSNDEFSSRPVFNRARRTRNILLYWVSPGFVKNCTTPPQQLPGIGCPQLTASLRPGCCGGGPLSSTRRDTASRLTRTDVTHARDRSEARAGNAPASLRNNVNSCTVGCVRSTALVPAGASPLTHLGDSDRWAQLISRAGPCAHTAPSLCRSAAACGRSMGGW